MNFPVRFLRKITWLNFSGTALIALLQRSPVARLADAVDEFVAGPSAGSLLKSAVAAAASLGAIDSLAGATVLSTSTSSPVSVTAGTSITPIIFTVTNTIEIGSWTITGQIPAGLALSAEEGGNTLTGPGNLDATSPGQSDGYGGTTGGNSTTTPVLMGTPTTPGTYTFNLEAFEYGAESGLNSNTFPFTVVVGAAGSAAVAPSITTSPQNQTVTAGSSVSFTVAASGSPSPTYQWNFNGNPISGATSSSYAIVSATSANAGAYSVTAANSAGSATSAAATLTVNGTLLAPAFTAQPMSVTVASGSTVAFYAAAAGTPTYQWTYNGAAVPGATSSILLINGASVSSVGNYAVVASNAAGSTTSNAATLTLTSTTNPGRLIDISCRAPVGTGANVLIAGLVVGGAGTSGTENLLIRASGPALIPYGVTGTLPDPELTLNSGSTVLATNNGWGGNATIASTATAVGAFAWTNPSSHDAALVEAAQAGAYTAEVSGASGDTGVALIEVYDATPAGTYTLATPRLVDISARVQVGTGSNVLIAGFVIGGSTAKTVLIRASGPALVPFGVTGTLPDPQLTLNSGSTVLATNTGWAGSPQIASTATSVGAFSWGATATADSALLVTLPPGSYTAEVAGASGDIGVALVEVYEVP